MAGEARGCGSRGGSEQRRLLRSASGERVREARQGERGDDRGGRGRLTGVAGSAETSRWSRRWRRRPRACRHAAASPPGRRKKTVLPLWAGPEQELGQAGKSGKVPLFLILFLFFYSFLCFDLVIKYQTIL